MSYAIKVRRAKLYRAIRNDSRFLTTVSKEEIKLLDLYYDQDMSASDVGQRLSRTAGWVSGRATRIIKPFEKETNEKRRRELAERANTLGSLSNHYERIAKWLDSRETCCAQIMSEMYRKLAQVHRDFVYAQQSARDNPIIFQLEHNCELTEDILIALLNKLQQIDPNLVDEIHQLESRRDG